LDERPNESALVTNLKNMIDAFGLIWFITGNMWLFADDDLGCRHPERSPVYKLCMSLLIINYIQICLPCIVAVLMIPVFCFCMPCLIRVLARLHDPRAQQQGATEDIIATLPLIVVTRDHLRQSGTGDDNACAICLNEMAVGEEARILQCKHLFHKQVGRGASVRVVSRFLSYRHSPPTPRHTPSLLCCTPPCTSAWTSGCGSTPRAPRAV
jgi:E3 ubiquitin-protein ligase RNF38/44